MHNLRTKVEFCLVKGSEIVRRRLRTADQLKGTVGSQQHLRGAELAVVVVTHGKSVGSGIMEYQDISDLDLGQAALDGKLIVVLAQTAGNIIDMIQNGPYMAGRIRLAAQASRPTYSR